MKLELLSKILENEPRFRYKQVEEALFRSFVSDWDEVSNLPKSLIEKLKEQCPIEIEGRILKSKKSRTEKAVIVLEDKNEIETVLITNKEGKHTICVSTQIGCPIKCEFCATGKMKFARNLTSGEIIDQVLFFSRILKKQGQHIHNVVYMGMGEPFLNYDNVIKSIKILNDKEKFNIGARNISISTVGITDGIKKLAKEKLQINLAISLHAPNDKIRDQIMVINKVFTIGRILNSVDKYLEATNRKVMFEYVMIKDVNDTDKCAYELANLMKKPLYMVNLIKYNKTGVFESSSTERIEKFMQILKNKGINVTKRHSFGGDIAGACGQLARNNKLEL